MDTCADVNIMPASIYKLMFNDPILNRLAPLDSELSMLIGNKVDLLGSCNFYMIHPDTKQVQAVTFYVSNDELGVLLSCQTKLTLGLVQVRSRLGYLPPRAPLVSSTQDHPSKTKHVQAITKVLQATTKSDQAVPKPHFNKRASSHLQP